MTTVGVSGRRTRLAAWSPYRKANAESAIRRSNGRAWISSIAALTVDRRTDSKPSALTQSATASHSRRLGDAMMTRGQLDICHTGALIMPPRNHAQTRCFAHSEQREPGGDVRTQKDAAVKRK